MPALRSRTVTHGRNMAGARALMRASGVAARGHRQADHRGRQQLHRVRPGPHPPRSRSAGSSPRRSTRPAAIAREFNTIAVDDGIAMGHGGMLYSLPSRDLIADSVEYMVEAHCADALICISNCDKITPGMLNAALRLNIPTVFVSGGPMEAGRATLVDGTVRKLDLIDAIVRRRQRERLRRGHPADRGERLPDLRLLLGHVHRQLDELPDRGDRPVAAGQRLGAGHPHRAQGAVRERRRDRRRDHQALLRAGRRDRAAAQRSPPARRSRTRWRSTSRWAARPTRSCTCSPPRRRPSVDFGLDDIDAVSRRVPCLAKVAPNVAPDGTYYMEDVHRAGGIPAILGELHRGRAAERGRPHRAQRLDRRVAEDVGRARRLAVAGGGRAVARGPGLRALGRPRSRSPSAGRRWTRTRPTAASATSSTRTPRTAASRSSRATWPSTAAS